MTQQFTAMYITKRNKTYVHIKTCTQTFIIVFIIAKKQKKHKSPSNEQKYVISISIQ